MYFFWSDMHVDHVRLAEEFRPSFGGSVEIHNANIRSRWDAVVGPDDTVFVPGDAAMGKRDQSVSFIGTFNGRKAMFPGNHDDVHPMYAHKVERFTRMQGIYGDVFEIHDPIVDFSAYIPGTIISHFPWWGSYSDHAEDVGREERYRPWHPVRENYPEGTVVIHGHTHSTERVSDHAVHVGVDAWPDGPVSIDVVAEMVEAARSFGR